jgi:hypothetical protein
MALTNRLSVAAAVAACTLGAAANADIVAGWTFQNSAFISSTTGSSTFTYPQTGTTTAFTGYHADARTKWYNNVGNGSTAAVNSDYWTVGDYYQASLSTTGYTGISLNFDMTRSASGPANFKVDISTNGGTSWSTISTVSVIQNAAAPAGPGTWTSATSYAAYTSTITGITAAENQASLLIRWISTSAASSTGGTARMDNVQVQGTLVPAPGAAALVGLAGLMARRRRA